MIDAHTHLNSEQLFWNRQEYIRKFESEWWSFLINVWANTLYNKNWIEIAQKSETLFKKIVVKSAIWWHPCDISTDKDFEEYISELKDLYFKNQNKIVAIWECGIDLHFPENAPVDVQQKVLKKQAELSRELNIPLMIHSRDAFYETIEVLKEFSDLKIYFHAWWYWKEELNIAEKTFSNLWLWCTNVIAYPSAQKIRDAIQNIKTAKILTETDAPYLPPQCLRGHQNEPVYVSYVYDKLSELLNIEKNNLKSLIENNTKDLFWQF